MAESATIVRNMHVNEDPAIATLEERVRRLEAALDKAISALENAPSLPYVRREQTLVALRNARRP